MRYAPGMFPVLGRLSRAVGFFQSFSRYSRFNSATGWLCGEDTRTRLYASRQQYAYAKRTKRPFL